ncbi:MAG: sigma-70 family RNA polymerase sigma factor [Armatimonadota bacterium]|jgi:RNA polymerase sigma-70 factor (ECF subfamily)|nr:sigma-70 family RNA polymerase sigma factor [Fimbriimonadaceae bacterium]MCZ8139007.1 sigma-70 family RNA polymerase sigma factor [Fimbriimonadaceae bacterium]
MRFGRASSQQDRYEREFRTIYSALYGTALRMTRDPDRAADLVQEASVRGYEAFDKFDGRNFKAWMLRIMTNLYINQYRKLYRTAGQVSLEDEHVEEAVAPPEEIPDIQFFSDMLEEEVEQALGDVPDTFRQAVILADIEGLSYDEIAVIVDVPVGTVRSRIARGRAHLRQSLERYAIERGYIKKSSIDE